MKTRTTRRVKGITREKRQKELEAIVDICLGVFELQGKYITNRGSYDYKALSNLTTLSPSTLRRLFNGKISLKCHINTLEVLCIAAGYKLKTLKNTVASIPLR